MKRTALALALSLAPAAAFAQATAPDTNPADVKPGAYTVEPTHTRVLFAVSHMGFTTWYGNFTGVTGSLTLDPKDLAKTAFDITIPANSVSTTNTKLDGELNSPEWFDTAKYPTIEFKSEKVVRTGKDTALVTGELSFHGVTKPETLKVSFNAAGINPLSKQYTVGFNATGTLKRSDFNQTTYVPLIGDEVTLTISAAFVQ
ncbi:YceI family protein [Acidocella sp. KAb 2-4]|uniref:YceI family protein n=1 Tax=Acidocella sp. KAb 2-4 TaxID=2885158 RepID=UPI001D064CDB|nr:YceI family protein [Acidocella sp. KAb 2-4]MCB5943871.1 YceI family protein [Acidocella sp. KAb 2-4]